ncbi:poxB regulator PoxA [Salinisphaera sp. C84B14]|uniref:EF-P lysine aminoacylase EpmA n=1 Tax=Salinisphaera sp. C84B14 TaxID=1304155 RepID=UPI003341C872
MNDWRPSASGATLARRARLLGDIRAFMAERGVLEVNTPLLASAAPAERGLASMQVDDGGYLVPSPEHGLKRLLAAGMGPIYQLGPVFRAGEAGRWHNPEFWMLEWYRPEASMADLVAETGALIETVAGVRCMQRCEYRVVFEAVTGLDPIACDTTALADWARQQRLAPVEAAADHDRAFWLDLIMSLAVQPTLGEHGPQCVIDFPAEDAVLVATDAERPGVARRFEWFWQGVELANGAQELTDADIARERMQREQRLRREAGAVETALDERLLGAMAAGLPPSAGVALGVDRLLALICGFASIGEALAFDWPRR